MLMSNR